MDSLDPDQAAAKAAGVDEAEIIRSDIEQTRAELAHTVDALTGKLDVKGRVTDKVADTKDKVTTGVSDAAIRVKQAVPPPVQSALDTTGRHAKAHQRELAIAGGGAAIIALFVLIARRRSA